MQEGIDERIGRLKESCDKLRELRERLNEQSSLYRQAESGLRQLKSVLDSEEEDVKRVDSAFTKFFLNLSGKYDERMDKELREAADARARYTLALNELHGLEGYVESIREEMRSLDGCEREYDEALREKRELLKSSGKAEGARIIELEGQLRDCKTKSRELSEAISCAESAKGAGERALEILRSARNWGTYDLLGGDGIADLVKHDKLSQAENELNSLKGSLDRLKRELRDVSIYFDAEARTDSGLRFVDFFFDGIFSAVAVNRHIDDTISSVTDTETKLRSLLARLKGEKSSADANAVRMEKEITTLTLETAAP